MARKNIATPGPGKPAFRILHLVCFVILAANSTLAQSHSIWSLDFLVVNETGAPLSNVDISIAYLDTNKPGKVTPSNWASHMTITNAITDGNGRCTVAGVGIPDAWQCHFHKNGYPTKYKMYVGPSDYTAIVGPGQAHQKHTEVIISNNAPLSACPPWSMTIKAVDESGRPAEDAKAGIYYMGKVAAGLTDQNGLFTFSTNLESFNVGLDVQKTGYYNVRWSIFLGSRDDYDPAKWDQVVALTLKKMVHPIPMYAKWVNLGIPVFDKPAGFDLIAGDWVAPYGKGTNADIIFNAHDEKRSRFDYDYKLVVSFLHSGDGIQEFDCPALVQDAPEGASDLRSSQNAPANGYQPEWIQVRSARPHPGGYSGNWNQNHNFYFRTTLSDGVHYGKIYGDFMQFRYYLNPMPNDRNVEFEVKHNLLTPGFADPIISMP